MSRRVNAKLTEGRITPLLIRLTIPMMAGMISMVIFNLADTFYIGQLGKDQLAAMSFTFPVVMVVQSIALGLGIGTSSVISRAIGTGDHSTVRRLASDALLLSISIVILTVIAGELTIKPLFTLLGAESRIIPLIESYMRIWYIGAVFVVVPMVGNNIIRATGDMKTPGLIMMTAAIINIIVDPLLIFGIGPFPEMGIAGGALATVFGRAVSLTLSSTVLIKREKLLSFRGLDFREVLSSWRKILFVGIPAAMTNIITPLSMGILTRLVAGFGVAAVAGFGVATRLEMLVLMLINALTSVMIPFTGQNWTSGNIDRIREAVSRSYLFSILWSLAAFTGFFFLGRHLAGLFNRDPEVINTVVMYLKIISLTYGFQGILLLSTGVLNALNKPIHSITLSLCRLFAVYIPLALVGSRLFGLPGIFSGGAAANFITGILAALVILKLLGFRKTG